MHRPLPAALGPLTQRVDALHFYDDEIDALVAALPPIPLTYGPSNAGLIALNLAFHNIGTLRVANEAVLSFRTLWLSGLITGVALPARLLFELWGAACYAEDLTIMLADQGRHSTAFDRSAELFLGSRYPVPQFSGDIVDIPSIHVMDMVRAIRRVRPDATDTYSFLSEACHPNYLQQTYFWMAGPIGDNWGNDRFRSYAQGLFERLVDTVEATIKGLVEASRNVQRQSGEYIAADRKRAK